MIIYVKPISKDRRCVGATSQVTLNIVVRKIRGTTADGEAAIGEELDS